MLGGGDLPAGQIQPLGACRATRSTLSRRGSNAAPRALGGESGGAGAEPRNGRSRSMFVSHLKLTMHSQYYKMVCRCYKALREGALSFLKAPSVW